MNLICTFLDQDDAELAEQICNLLKDGEETETSPASTNISTGNCFLCGCHVMYCQNLVSYHSIKTQ